MKKILALTLVAILLAGCGATSVKTGLGHNISIEKSADASSEAEGLAQVDTIMAAVTVDSSNKILGVVIDTAQTKVNFDTTGKITSDLAAEQKTKVELGFDYGMKKAGSAREWFEQIAELEKWMVGKTVDKITAIKDASEDADLKSKVSVSISGYQAAVAEAVANAR
jgi:PBP1b-binding outer membrane lipoprotein LpoB